MAQNVETPLLITPPPYNLELESIESCYVKAKIKVATMYILAILTCSLKMYVIFYNSDFCESHFQLTFSSQ